MLVTRHATTSSVCACASIADGAVDTLIGVLDTCHCIEYPKDMIIQRQCKSQSLLCVGRHHDEPSIKQGHQHLQRHERAAYAVPIELSVTYALPRPSKGLGTTAPLSTGGSARDLLTSQIRRLRPQQTA
ncbi:hypothetical protein EVAR_36442_1 [Eumeta japonica]|uniref:Uncharacterized protein n=1 Tax=Eumeta variegata TaxID=151549 RepID=A0A4C1VNL1_EUMVA|nr:hypothetical protein EVAR_36442_1 [Eumeta japonica]